MGRSLPPFEAFLDENGPTVYRFLRAAVGPKEADDVYQETFLAALRAYPRVRERDKLDRWVLAIASRKVIDHHRGTARRPIPTDEIADTVGGDEPTLPDAELWNAVRELPAKQRVAVVHRHVLDRSYDDIATIMGSSVEAARANVSQALKRLREVMA
jgi:RNA polymerase sigma factor (sigma-70 family)